VWARGACPAWSSGPSTSPLGAMKPPQRALSALLLIFPAVAWADFAWPPGFYLASYSIWWVVLSGLSIEWIVYYFAWRRGLWGTTKLTLGVNAVSALGGALYTYGSVVFMAPPKLAIAFIWSSPLLILAITVVLEYWAGALLFALPRTLRTLCVFTAANVPSVAIAIYGTARLVGDALSPHGA
jgi:hypothetical protein